MSFILSGEGDLVVGDRILRYTPGSIFVIGSYLPHLFKSDTSASEHSEMLTLFFTRASFGTFSAFDELQEIHPLLNELSLGIEVQSNQSEVGSIFCDHCLLRCPPK